MKRGNRIVVWGLVAIFVLTLAYFGVGLFVASRLTAPDNVPMEATPASVGLDFREVEVESTDGIRLAGWWVPKENSSRTVLLVHGWGGNKSNEQVFWRLTGYGHVEAYTHPEYKARLLDFLESLKFEEAA